MERIKHALEKAKGQMLHARRPSGGTKGRTSAQDLRELRYSETRVVELDPLHMAANRIVALNKNEPASGRFDLLRTQVLRKMEQKGWRSIAVVSPTPGSGKTVVAVNLAMAIAQQTDKTAVLVDFDLRRPSVARVLGIESDTSLNDVLSGAADLSKALVNPGIARFVVLPTMRPEPKPAEMLASRRVEEMIVELRERYAERVVLFDLPPLLAVDDALAVLPKIDCALVVVGNGEATKNEVQETVRYLGSTGLLGIVLNKAGAAPKNYY